jgi:hypothetical protein
MDWAGRKTVRVEDGRNCRFLSAPRDHRFAVVKKKARAAPLGMRKVCSIDAGLAQEFVGAENQA